MPLDTPLAPAPGEDATPWPEIDRSLLEEVRPPPVPFPLDVLPPTWRAWVEASPQAFTPVDYLAQGLLAAVAAACGGVMTAATPQWVEPLVLWQALVGGPSSGKSPALDAARALVEDISDDADAGDDDDDDDDKPAIVLEDSPHAVAAALSFGRRGVTLWRDELEDALAEARRGRRRADWLAGWAGACGRLSIVGALQPDRLAHAVGEAGDGFAARFLYAWPEPTGCGALSSRAADDAAVRAMLQCIASFAGPAKEPGVLALEPGAAAGLKAFLPDLRQQMREADGLEAAWLGKGAGTVVRLAGLLTLMHWAEALKKKKPAGVSAQRLQDALRLWSGYFHPHARSVFQRAGSSGRDRTARRAARWLRRADLDQVSREDIRREALCQTVNAADADEVIARLEAGGVLRSLPPQGFGRPKRRWEVNPGLQ